MENVFKRNANEYTRDYDVEGNYIHTAAKTLSLKYGKPLSTCIDFVKGELEKRPLQWPEMKTLTREPRGDRKKALIKLDAYLEWIQKNGHILAPNMITYANPKMERSYLSDFIDLNMERRNTYKSLAKRYDMEGNEQLSTFNNLMQANVKFFNNSISGACISPYNVIHNASAHTTLTSTCRCVTSYSNAILEKFLISNRHYYSPEVTKANIAFLATRSDLGLIEKTIKKYNLQVPTAEFLFDMVMTCVGEYWGSDEEERIIFDMLSNLTPLERAAVGFCGDLNALTTVNDKVMRDMYSRLIEMPTVPHPNPDEVIAKADDDLIALVGMLAGEWLVGIMPKNLKADNPEMYGIYGALIEKTLSVFDEYADLMRAFFSIDNLPHGIHSFPTSIRKAVIASDTDSSIFTTQNQVKWFCGDIGFGDVDKAVAGITTYIGSQLVSHSIALLSGQLGVEEKVMFKLNMKTEYYFKIFIVTARTKHYLALMSAKEGNVFVEPKLEVKGVALKDAKVPSLIKDVGEEYYKTIMLLLGDGEKLTPKKVMSIPGKLEYTIKKSILEGDCQFYRYTNIQPKEAYKLPERSVWLYSDLWNSVFARKYGAIEQLPAQCLKLTVNLPNIAAIEAWIETLDMELRKPMRDWIEKTGKTYFTQLLVPVDLLQNGMIPVEFRLIVDLRKLFNSLLMRFYIFMECLGIYKINKHLTEFVSDVMTEEEIDQNLLFPINKS